MTRPTPSFLSSRSRLQPCKVPSLVVLLINSDQRRRSGATLLEVVMNMATIAVLMAGMASALHVTYLSAPKRTSESSVALRASELMETICNDLRYAVSIVDLSPQSIQFSVADRDGMGPLVDMIEYSWNSSPGSPLLRTINGNTTTLASNVHQFQLRPTLRSVPLPRTHSESEEVLLASYQSTQNLADYSVRNSLWLGQVLRPQLPGAESWKLTRFVFQAKGEQKASDLIAMSLCAESNGLPGETIETTNIQGTIASSSYQSISFTVESCPFLPTDRGLCVTFTTLLPTEAMTLNCQASAANPAPHSKVSSRTGAAGWQVDESESLLFEAWGKYRSADPQAYQEFVQALEVTLQQGDSSGHRVVTVVRTPNEPEVPAP